MEAIKKHTAPPDKWVTTQEIYAEIIPWNLSSKEEQRMKRRVSYYLRKLRKKGLLEMTWVPGVPAIGEPFRYFLYRVVKVDWEAGE